ncbi:MAG TPA: hypothetical protein VJR89_42665 [Polyangiales bacterium]|nr:hypothetical protein [Polyangiales bacterium]
MSANLERASVEPVRVPQLRRERWAAARAAVVERRWPSLWALLLAACGGLLIAQGTPLWWLGAAFCVGAALCIWHAYRPQLAAANAWLQTPRRVLGRELRVGALLLDVAYLGALTWVATIMLRDVFPGARPISHDHTVHFAKAYQLHERFLPQGRLHGYSHEWFAGYPVDYLYPIGTDLFVNLVHTLGLGLLRFNQSYGVAFWLFHVLTGIAGYRFGKLIGGPHVGLITGFLMITDMSTFRFGGWAYTIEYGVWPQALSLVFALFASLRVPEIYASRSWRPVAAFALWMGAAIVTHPIEFIYLGVLLLAAVIAGLFSPRIHTAAGTLRLLAAYALSALCASAWLLPFLATRKQTTPMGVWWDSTYEMGRGVVQLNGFPGTVGQVLALGCFAAVIMLRSRQFLLMLTALCAALVPLLSGSTFIDELHLPNLSSAFSKVQWLRMSTMAKPFWFAMAAYLAVACVRWALALVPKAAEAPARMPRSSYVREVLFGTIVAFVSLPILVPAAQSFYTSNILKTLETETDRAQDPDRAALVDWLKHNLPRDGFYRVCVNTGHNHDLLDLSAELPMPIYKRGFTPAENFIYKVNVEDSAVLQAVNVRYMVAKKFMPSDDYEDVVSFGQYRVYRFRHWQPDPFLITQGTGAVKIEHWSDDEIVLRAAPGSHGKLRLNVSYFPRWKAYRDGKPISLWTTSLPEAKDMTGFMTVWLEPGVYRFAFELSLLDRLSGPLSVLGVLIALLLIAADSGKTGWRSRLRSLGERALIPLEALSGPRFAWLRRGGLVVCAGGFVLGMIGLARWQPPLALEQLDGAFVKRVRFDFLENLSQGRAQIQYLTAERRCRRVSDRFICRTPDGQLDNEKYIASTPAEIEEYRMVRCIRFRPDELARTRLTFARVPAGDAIVGYYGVERAGRLLRLKRPVDFRIFVNGGTAYEGATESDNKMHWFQAPVGRGPTGERSVEVTFEVSSPNVTKRFFCFYAQMADLGRNAAGEAAPEAPRPGPSEDEGAP